MQTFVINLARRRDRLEAMTAQMKRLGLAFERVPALDAREVSASLLTKYFEDSGPLGVLPKGDRCCSLSHCRAWSAFLAGGEPYAAILEDDVVLEREAARLLRDGSWIPEDADLLKLEHFGPAGQRVLVGETREVLPGKKLARIHSRHTGAAAYIISRRAARRLAAFEGRWNVPVDHLLFNPNVSPLAVALRPWQLLPAVARQAEAAASDILPERREQRRFGFSYMRREVVRAFYELRLLPEQIGRLLTGQGALVRVGAGGIQIEVAAAPEEEPRLKRRSQGC